jgi:hypothetical protein
MLKYKYGLSLETFRALVQAQEGVCAICGARPAVAVDHDHVTGRIRGILCKQCNLAIGLIGESMSTLKNAMEYLKKYRED